MKNFVYSTIPKTVATPSPPLKSLYEDFGLTIIFYIVFVLTKLVLMETFLNWTDFIWMLVSSIILGSACFFAQTIKDPRISLLGHGLLIGLGMGLAGLYGMFGLILSHYDILYLGWIIVFLMCLIIPCTYGWVLHCIRWDKFDPVLQKSPNGWLGMSVGATCIITAIIGVSARIYQTGGHWISELAIILLSILLIAIAVPFSTIGFLKLYYFYRYLRKDEE